MKIHELIEELRQFSQNAEVRVQVMTVDDDGDETFTDMDIGRIYPFKPKLRTKSPTVTITLQ